MKFLFTFLIVLGYSTLVYCQSFSVTGKLADDNGPIEFANIVCYADTSSAKIIKATVSDSIGNFSLEGLPLGQHKIKVQLVGYRPFQRIVDLKEGNFTLGKILLQSNQLTTKEITITANKQIIQKSTQGLVVNVAENITQMGGTATDVLRNTPTVTVDADGAVSLRGKSPLILINGRQSGLSNTDQIPASSIEKIEIITNPAAKYDAASEAGIINIILKKNKEEGLKGSLVAGAGYGALPRSNTGLMLSYKTEKVNYSFGYDNRFANRMRLINIDRTNYNLPDQYNYKSQRNDYKYEDTHNFRFDTDFKPFKGGEVAFQVIYELDRTFNNEKLNTRIYTQTDSLRSNFDRNSAERNTENLLDLNLDFKQTFNNERHFLSANAAISDFNETELTDIYSQSLDNSSLPIGSLLLQGTKSIQTGRIQIYKVDYQFPISPEAEFLIGTKTILRNTDVDYGSGTYRNSVYVADSFNTNLFRFGEQIYAGYGQLQGFIGQAEKPKFRYTIGLRAEQVWNNGEVINTILKFKNEYLSLFPSLNVSYHINESSFFKATYGRRINRPGLGSLNPFTDLTDSLNRHRGNPNLQPEYIDAFELGHNTDWSNYSFYSVLYYRYATNSITNFVMNEANGVVVRYPINAGKNITYGIESIFTAKPNTWYDFNLSVVLAHQSLAADIGSATVSNEVTNWSGKWINNLQLEPFGRLQVALNYQSPTATLQGKRLDIYFVDLGYRKSFDRWPNTRFGLAITDLLNTQRNIMVLSDPAFGGRMLNKLDTRSIVASIAFTWGLKIKDRMLDNQFSNE